jgi:hypothetical protein
VYPVVRINDTSPADIFVPKEHDHVGQQVRLYMVSRLALVARAPQVDLKTGEQHLREVRRAARTQVHHLTYLRLFNEDMADLMALCRQCHAEIHWRQPANDNQIQYSFDFPDEPEDAAKAASPKRP